MKLGLKIFIGALALTLCNIIIAQGCYWQQHVTYQIDMNLNVEDHGFEGREIIEYTNNSPDTLNALFFHLYFNAFQPGSMMDMKSLNIVDPDRRVGDRISKLTKDEMGIQKVTSLKMNGKKLDYNTEGTVLEVKLKNGILPNSVVNIELTFEGQVPIQIRRSGRDNKEGISYSMSQWFPKLAEYDYMGWHADPYVGREFYGVWGSFDVSLTLDSKYIVAATGVLSNANEIGYGYSNSEPIKRNKKTTWHFKADNVHDFVWTADPDYKHVIKESYNGTKMHFFYQPSEKTESWSLLPDIMDEALHYMNDHFGVYPYTDYSFIQGGDGGMEYAMATLITGERPLISLVGVSVHEWIHSWFQNVLGTNEALYPWMDEGFTSYAETCTMEHLKALKLVPGETSTYPWKETIEGYSKFVMAGRSEALSTHADHYTTNAAYGVGSYTKGELCLLQLSYIMGKPVFDKAILRYFNTWKFKHPSPNDFFRIMEKESGLELDWFNEYWINTTFHADYAIDALNGKELVLHKMGNMPMPLDVLVTTKDGKKELYYIPLVIMRGEKSPDLEHDKYILENDWPWTNPTYTLKLKCGGKDIESIIIDPSWRMVDLDHSNNVWPRAKLEVDSKY